MLESLVTTKGQTTLPKAVCEALRGILETAFGTFSRTMRSVLSLCALSTGCLASFEKARLSPLTTWSVRSRREPRIDRLGHEGRHENELVTTWQLPGASSTEPTCRPIQLQGLLPKPPGAPSRLLSHLGRCSTPRYHRRRQLRPRGLPLPGQLGFQRGALIPRTGTPRRLVDAELPPTDAPTWSRRPQRSLPVRRSLQ